MLVLIFTIVFIVLYFKLLQFSWNTSVVPLFNLKEASLLQIALLYIFVSSILRQSSVVNCLCSPTGENERKDENQLLS